MFSGRHRKPITVLETEYNGKDRRGRIHLSGEEKPRYEGDKGKYLRRAFRQDYLPRCLAITAKGNFMAESFGFCDYVLIDFIHTKVSSGLEDVCYDFYGTNVIAKLVPCETGTAVYYKVDQYLAPRTRNILGALSRVFLGDVHYYYNDICSMDNLLYQYKEVEKRKPDGKYRHLLSEIKNLPISKISGEHHIHFTAEEVVRSMKLSRASLEALRLPKDVSTSFMAGMLIWLRNLNEKELEIVKYSGILDVNSAEEYVKRAKTLSVRAKSYQNIVEEDLRMLFEPEVLANRAVGQVDWEGEKLNRSRPNLASITPEEVYEEAVNIFRRADTSSERAKTLTWKQFWKARWQWSAAGSIHSQYEEDMELVPQERELKNKFITLLKMKDVDLEYLLARKPQIYAYSSVKYEWGKQRAIYGTDLTSYILAHFVFYNCENTLSAEFPVGKKARPAYVNARVQATMEDKVPFCLDFEDFNSQHSLEAMQSVMKAFRDVWDRKLSDEQKRALAWSIESLNDTWVQDSCGTKTTYKVNGTLMSGWRLTTFVNSVLNRIYTRKLFLGEKLKYRSVHNGDDVLIGCDNFAMAAVAVRQGLRENIRLQRGKCAFGGLAEFLRVDHVRGESGQYLTRNIATLVHSRIESKIAVKATDVVEAMEERLAEFATRGGSVREAAALRDVYYSRTAGIFGLTKEDLYIIKTTHRVCGGVSERIDSRVDKKIVTETKTKAVSLPDELPGVYDYAEDIVRSLDIGITYQEAVDKIHSATVKAVMMERNVQSIADCDDVEQNMTYRALYKCHRGELNTGEYGKAKLVGFLLDVLADKGDRTLLGMVMRGAKNKMKFLTIVT
jgi:hypothetical protein